MKYSVLFTGKNRVIKEDLFNHFWAEFECLTCSGYFEDIRNHLKYFTPDALVCCLHEEDPSSMQQVVALIDTLDKKNISVVIVGSSEDCSIFVKFAPHMASLVIEKPFTSSQVSNIVAKFLDKKRKLQKEEEKRLLEEQRKKDALDSKRKHILVIDDDPLMLKLINEYLRDEYDVATAISGKVARKFLSTKTTDLIFLDYEMPGETGPQILEQLHKNEATKHIPVIFLTSIMDREKIQKALSLKPEGYLLKPVDHERLVEAIEKQLG